tara:strand:+ start:142 stop:549 length:408 start_codon:yes stop_codon:yes gene_type:complete
MIDKIKGLLAGLNRKEKQPTVADEAKELFPTSAHANAANELYGILDPSQGHGNDSGQYRWVGETNHPWELQPNAFHDMVETSEDMPNSVKNALYHSYYTMNTPDGMPHDVWQNWISKQKNIDILISAANRDDSPY